MRHSKKEKFKVLSSNDLRALFGGGGSSDPQPPPPPNSY